MKFTPINRTIFNLLTKDITCCWFYINRTNTYVFRKGFFKGKTYKEVYDMYNENDNKNAFFEYLQWIYDEEANWKDKKVIYEIYNLIKNRN